jgi:hypothetical protein
MKRIRIKRNPRCRSLRIEPLEHRNLLACSAEFTNGFLGIGGDWNGNQIEVTSAVGSSGTHYVLVIADGVVIFNGASAGILWGTCWGGSTATTRTA